MSAIVWYSEHKPTDGQLREFDKLYPGCEVVIDPKPFNGADDIVRRFRASGAQDIHVVAPMGVVREMCTRGVYPLWSVMRPCSCAKAEVHVHRDSQRMRCFRFHKMYRALDVKVELIEAKPGEVFRHSEPHIVSEPTQMTIEEFKTMFPHARA